MNARFTIDGSETLEKHLESVCKSVVAGITALIPPGKLEAIFLGGGYGRGEGGVLRTDAGDRAYNDLEFYICIRGHPRLNERRFGATLHHLAERLTPVAGIEVEFKISSLGTFSRSPVTMFVYDLAQGHRTIFGSDKVFTNPALRDAKQIPLYEATRLLMNRCSGLLFAQEKLRKDQFTPEDADFVGRNQAKAQLGLGDVILCARGEYHWSCRERNVRLKRLAEAERSPLLQTIYCHHNLGVEFKLHPQQKSGGRDSFFPLQAELTALAWEAWKQVEEQRLKSSFASPRDYALSNSNKCPETSALRNRLVNAKTFGPKMLIQPAGSRYPRERILIALSLLLWQPNVLNERALLERAQHSLNTNASTFSGLVAAYQKLWQRFN